jgi:cytochrome P450
VPAARIMDIDVYAAPAPDQDFIDAWCAIKDASPSSLVWTPRNGSHWIATRGPEIEAIYRDHEAFSSRIVLVPRSWGEAFQIKPTTLDPPEHRPYRRIVNAALLPSHVEASKDHIRALAAARIEAVRASGRCEFISDVAAHIPISVFLHLANLPQEDARALPCYAEPILDNAGAKTEARVMDRFADYLRPHCRARMAAPGDDLLSRIVTGQAHGRPLREDEAVDMVTTVMTGGLDTITSTLGLTMGFLARHPDHRRRLAADPGIAGAAVTELLRRHPIMTKARLCVRARDVDGVTLVPGDMVILPPLHGLDEHIFDAPLEVRFDRSPQPNVTFGAGVHRCPGALLAQTQIEIVLTEWLARVPDFELDPALPPKTQSGVLGAMLQLGLTWRK